MVKISYTIVDVFAEQQYTGNQLAVVHPGVILSKEEMQTIAREFHFSETTFILSDTPRDGGYDIRIFTPAEEVPFAGHPTIGTAYVIQQEIIKSHIEKIILHEKAGDIPVTFSKTTHGSKLLWMEQLSPTFGMTYDAATIAALLGITTQDIDSRYLIQMVSTGLPFIIVPLKTLAAVKRAKLQLSSYTRLLKTADAQAVLLFCAEPYNPAHHLNARMFADELGVTEDPATGSANGCLAAYLVEYEYFGKSHIEIQVEQGYEILRPSVLHLNVWKDEGRFHIHVGGQVVHIANGELFHQT
ncbi:PhzF family phenazine biosynthesis protein [candidate division KSB1 bacterium]|nr:PhzF family phenazine biosynthesis protein [candidate division KSB1 bacterium]